MPRRMLRLRNQRLNSNFFEFWFNLWGMSSSLVCLNRSWRRHWQALRCNSWKGISRVTVFPSASSSFSPTGSWQRRTQDLNKRFLRQQKGGLSRTSETSNDTWQEKLVRESIGTFVQRITAYTCGDISVSIRIPLAKFPFLVRWSCSTIGQHSRERRSWIAVSNARTGRKSGSMAPARKRLFFMVGEQGGRQNFTHHRDLIRRKLL